MALCSVQDAGRGALNALCSPIRVAVGLGWSLQCGFFSSFSADEETESQRACPYSRRGACAFLGCEPLHPRCGLEPVPSEHRVRVPGAEPTRGLIFSPGAPPLWLIGETRFNPEVESRAFSERLGCVPLELGRVLWERVLAPGVLDTRTWCHVETLKFKVKY